MKKVIINVILVVVVIALVWICYGSLMSPIGFKNERDKREVEIKKRLIDIRAAQVEYRTVYHNYTASFDTLIAFVEHSKLPVVRKVGELNDFQLENGITEQSALAMVAEAQKTGNWSKAEEAGVRNFRRDTVWVPMKDTIFAKGFNPDSLRFVPFGNGAQFEMAIRVDTTKSGDPICLFEAKTPFTAYLKGINDQEMKNLISDLYKQGRYCGLKVGDIENANNNAGNWE